MQFRLTDPQFVHYHIGGQFRKFCIISIRYLFHRFFEKLGDYPTALKFLVISRSENEALRLCKEHGLVELYAELVTTELNGLEEGERLLTMLAAHLEQQGSLLAAAHCYYHTAQFNKVFRLQLISELIVNNCSTLFIYSFRRYVIFCK